MGNHMTRKQITLTAGLSEDKWPKHVQTCEICRQSVMMLQQFPMTGRLHLVDPPDAWVNNVKVLAAKPTVRSLVTHLVGRLVFDSWLLPTPAGVRGFAATTDRRLRYEVDSVTVDMRVERHGRVWSSVAQISGAEGKTVNLLINGRVILLGTGGMAQHSGSQPPRQIALRVDDREAILPEVSWRRRQT